MWFNDYLKPFGKNILYLGWFFTAAYLENFLQKRTLRERRTKSRSDPAFQLGSTTAQA